MPNLFIAALALAQAQAAEIKAPYKPDDKSDYKVAIVVKEPQSGTDVNVDMTVHVKIAKKTDAGFEGSFSWSDLTVEGEGDQPDQEFAVVLKSNGMLKAVNSDSGPGMRRMLAPFYFVYPEKSVAKGDTWKYEDKKDEAVDGHTETIEYTVAGTEKVKDKDATRVTFKLSENDPDPMKAEGTYWIGADGRILKFEINLTSWPVPVASQIFDAKITGEIKG